MKQDFFRALAILLTVLFSALMVFGLPFAWILRDGLGPGATASSYWDAIEACLMTFYIGPVLGLLGVAAAGAWMLSRGGKRSQLEPRGDSK